MRGRTERIYAMTRDEIVEQLWEIKQPYVRPHRKNKIVAIESAVAILKSLPVNTDGVVEPEEGA